MQSKIKLLILFLLIFSFSQINAQELLNQKISIVKDDYKVEELLKIIESYNSVKFSYNSEIIDIQKTIFFSANNKRLEDCLNEIFENKIKYQVSGKHIILLKKLLPEEKKIPKQKISVFGTIINAENNETLSDVSVYDLDKQYSTISNYQGEFSFTINSNEEFRGLSLGKRGFYDTVIIINMSENEILNISLRPKETPIEAITPIETSQLNIEKIRTTELFIPKATIINSQNLEYIDNAKLFQISFLPGISSNLSNFGVFQNNISMNVLIGYSRGVKGIETAGLMNFNKENVSGIQFAGLTNTVGGQVTGLQGAGLFNVVLKDVNACQLSGLGSFVHGNTTGFQGSGIFNSNFGTFDGVQLGGIANLTTKHFKGVQTSGILNISGGGINGAQAGGILNFNWGVVNGMQVAGLLNVATDSVKGGQISGLVNVGKTSWMQFAGVLNISKSSYCQASSVINFSTKSKCQIATLCNVTAENQGLQLAIFNVCDTSSGVSIGLFSFVRKGLHKFIIHADEIFYTNLSFVTGNDKFYNIFTASYLPADKLICGYGYGFGHKFHLSKSTKINLELTSKSINFNTIWNADIFTYYKIATVFEFSVKNKFSIYAGPSINFYFGNKEKNKEIYEFISDIKYIPLKQQITNSKISQKWIGFTLGLSL